MTTIKIGQFVKNKEKELYGTTHYSAYGLSVHFYDIENSSFTKVLGAKPESVELNWAVYLDGETMPDGYEWNDEWDRLYIKPKQKE